MFRNDLPVCCCQETISLTVLSSPAVCSCFRCPAVIHTPGQSFREGKGAEWRTKGQWKSQQGKPHIRWVVFLLLRGLSPFTVRSKSKLGAAQSSHTLSLPPYLCNASFGLCCRTFSQKLTGHWDHSVPVSRVLPLALGIPPSTPTPNPNLQLFVFLGLSKQRWEPVRPGLTEATAEDKHFTSRILLLYKELRFYTHCGGVQSKYTTSSLVSMWSKVSCWMPRGQRQCKCN